MSLPYTKRVLPNGLEVVVHEDHRVPLVAVSVWYRVGSRNEQPGRTGLAHLFEHLMFEGSAHHPHPFFDPLQQAGATVNGSTSADRTDYWEVVPREALKLALWLEADRMGWLLPALTEGRFEAQRGVVINERRQNYENRPYGLAAFALSRAVYPDGHPYSWPTIGEPDDLRAMTSDDARAFFARHYHPANASIAIAGDVTAAEAFDLVESLFGEIPAGPPVLPVIAPDVAARPSRVVLEDRVDLPRLYLAWPSAALFAPGDAELDLAGDLLGYGRTSRLYARLIHHRRIATEVVAAQASRDLGGMFQVVATAAPGETLTSVYDAIVDELARLAADGPADDELVRGRAQAEAAFVYRTQPLGGFGGRADQLNAYNVHHGEPDWFDQDLARYLSATRTSVRDAVRRWIAPGANAVVSVVPYGRSDLAVAS